MDRGRHVAKRHAVHTVRHEGGAHGRPFARHGIDGKGPAGNLGGEFEEGDAQSHAPRVPRGEKRIGHTGNFFFAHSAAVIPDRDQETVGRFIRTDGDVHFRGAGADGILRDI